MSEIPANQVYSFFVGDPDPDNRRPRLRGEPDICVTVHRASFTEDKWPVENIQPGWHSSAPGYLTRGALTGGGFWMSSRQAINPAHINFTLEEAQLAANEAIMRYIPYSR